MPSDSTMRAVGAPGRCRFSKPRRSKGRAGRGMPPRERHDQRPGQPEQHEGRHNAGDVPQRDAAIG